MFSIDKCIDKLDAFILCRPTWYVWVYSELFINVNLNECI